MRKIPTLYVRDPEDRRYVTDEVTPGCEWVLAGEGTATRKIDGTCTMLDEHGEWWARREVRPGKPKPDGFVAVEYDETTGKTVGWEPIEASPFVAFWREAIENRLEIEREAEDRGLEVVDPVFQPGTYELIGPKINRNPEKMRRHALIPHGRGTPIDPAEVDVSTPMAAVASARERGWEGIVWHHPDGRMAKLKVRDIRW